PKDLKGISLVLKWQPPAEQVAGWSLAGYRIKSARLGKPLEVQEVIADPKATETRIQGTHPRYLFVAEVEALWVPAGQKLVMSEDNPTEVAASCEHAFSKAVQAGPTRPIAALFDPNKFGVLLGVLLYGAIVFFSLRTAQRRELYIRPIAGLQAVEDAIGRATEMGQPLLYVSGLAGVSSISTIASMLILGHLARRTAAYETPVLVPCTDPLVMAAEREIVREAHLEAGHPEAFRPENIFFITDSQFGYVAAVDGIIMRERPAACFYMGYFYAESLILAETGNVAGAVQIAGTDADTQLPFFITACDYTLMGEELYAAGAYLSRHPMLVAQLKGQDIGKTILAALLVVGVLLATLSEMGVMTGLYEAFMRALSAG
ncbi:MAG: hypothetical protein J7M26_08470, partial [Armatimonadetes bacterium]|nr:hypothetical protein [Armatimonadota bacterium]